MSALGHTDLLASLISIVYYTDLKPGINVNKCGSTLTRNITDIKYLIHRKQTNLTG